MYVYISINRRQYSFTYCHVPKKHHALGSLLSTKNSTHSHLAIYQRQRIFTHCYLPKIAHIHSTKESTHQEHYYPGLLLKIALIHTFAIYQIQHLLTYCYLRKITLIHTLLSTEDYTYSSIQGSTILLSTMEGIYSHIAIYQRQHSFIHC